MSYWNLFNWLGFSSGAQPSKTEEEDERYSFVLGNGLQLSVMYGDITKMAAGAVVVGEDADFSAKGAVARVLLQAGGEDYEGAREQLQNHIQEHGCTHLVYACPGGGNLMFDYVFHAITSYRGDRPDNWSQHLSSLFYNVGVEAERREVEDVVTPLLGAGQAQGPLEVSLHAALHGLVMLSPRTLRHVILVELEPERAKEMARKIRQMLIASPQPPVGEIPFGIPGLQSQARPNWQPAGNGYLGSSGVVPGVQSDSGAQATQGNFVSVLGQGSFNLGAASGHPPAASHPAVMQYRPALRYPAPPPHPATSPYPPTPPYQAAPQYPAGSQHPQPLRYPLPLQHPPAPQHFSPPPYPPMPTDGTLPQNVPPAILPVGQAPHLSGAGQPPQYTGPYQEQGKNAASLQPTAAYEEHQHQEEGYGQHQGGRWTGEDTASRLARFSEDRNEDPKGDHRGQRGGDFGGNGTERNGRRGSNDYRGVENYGGTDNYGDSHIYRGTDNYGDSHNYRGTENYRDRDNCGGVNNYRGNEDIRGGRGHRGNGNRGNQGGRGARRQGYVNADKTKSSPRRKSGQSKTSRRRPRQDHAGDDSPKVRVNIVLMTKEEDEEEDEEEERKEKEKEEEGEDGETGGEQDATQQEEEEADSPAAAAAAAPEEGGRSGQDCRGDNPRSSFSSDAESSDSENTEDFNAEDSTENSSAPSFLHLEPQIYAQVDNVTMWSSSNLDEGNLENDTYQSSGSSAHPVVYGTPVDLEEPPEENSPTEEFPWDSYRETQVGDEPVRPAPEEKGNAGKDEEVERRNPSPGMGAGPQPRRVDRSSRTFVHPESSEHAEEAKPKPRAAAVPEGRMPEGKMVHSVKPGVHLEGFPDCGAILIEYSFPNGTQGKGHPAPGQPYKGTFRRAFLPYNQEGRRVLDLLKKAFDKKLTFELKKSGPEEWGVEFADIPHKTSLRGGPDGNGFPDPGYLKEVGRALGRLGIT